MIKNFNFGIELEMENVDREDESEILAKLFKTQYYYIEDKNWGVKDDKSREWRLEYDGSLEKGGCELVTPILTYKDLPLLKKIINKIKIETSATVSKRCGLHIHIGAENLNALHMINLLNLFYANEDLLYNAIGTYKERYTYCQMIEKELIDRMSDIHSNKRAFKVLWYNTLAPGEDKKDKYNNSRYYGINFHSLFTIGTVEFRVFNSTFDFKKIKTYLDVALAMVDFSKTNEKYTLKAIKKNYLSDFLDMLKLDGYEYLPILTKA